MKGQYSLGIVQGTLRDGGGAPGVPDLPVNNTSIPCTEGHEMGQEDGVDELTDGGGQRRDSRLGDRTLDVRGRLDGLVRLNEHVSDAVVEGRGRYARRRLVCLRALRTGQSQRHR